MKNPPSVAKGDSTNPPNASEGGFKEGEGGGLLGTFGWKIVWKIPQNFGTEKIKKCVCSPMNFSHGTGWGQVYYLRSREARGPRVGIARAGCGFFFQEYEGDGGKRSMRVEEVNGGGGSRTGRMWRVR